MDDDVENYRSNNWHHEDNHMLLKDTWKNSRCREKENQISLNLGWISHQNFPTL
jgi:hypothetical protein